MQERSADFHEENKHVSRANTLSLIMRASVPSMLSIRASANSWLTSISSFATKQACAQEFLLGEELNDIVVGLEQWLGARKHRLQELKKTRKRLEEEITAIKKYFALAGTRCRVGAGNAKLASLPSQIIIDEKEARPLLVMDVPDQCREILLGRSESVIMSVPEEACRILREAKRSRHTEELFQIEAV